MKGTDALFDVFLLVLFPVQVVVEHRLQVGVVPLVAGPVLVDGVREQGVEAEADQVGLAHLS